MMSNNAVNNQYFAALRRLTCGRTGDACTCGCYEESVLLKRYWRQSDEDVNMGSPKNNAFSEIDHAVVKQDELWINRQKSSTSDLTDDDDSDDLSQDNSIVSMIFQDNEDDDNLAVGRSEPKYFSFADYDAMSCDSRMSTIADNGMEDEEVLASWTIVCSDMNCSSDGYGRNLSFMLRLDGSTSVINLEAEKIVDSVRAIVQTDPEAKIKAYFEWNDLTMLGDNKDIIELIEDIIKNPKLFDGSSDDDDCSSRLRTSRSDDDSESQESSK